jgi:hypothetical protein
VIPARSARAAVVLLALIAQAVSAQVQRLPDRLQPGEFWTFIETVSEPDGFFSSRNLVSNEIKFQHAIPALLQRTKPGAVYLGVGPEQNFTYIAALKPAMAVIVDVRRGNLHLHMMYKALFELSPTRSEFVARLFSRSPSRGPDTLISVDSLFSASRYSTADTSLFRKNFAEISDLLLRRHAFALSPADMEGIRSTYEAFAYSGQDIEYSYPGYSMGRLPTFATLMTENDGQVQRSFLATEGNYRFVRGLQLRNLIIPVVGDFGGPKAIQSVGAWLRQRGATVQAFYVSNVEQYLFRSPDAWRAFHENVGRLPLDSSSMFIRLDASGGVDSGTIVRRPNMVCSILQQLAAYRSGRITSYPHVMTACA